MSALTYVYCLIRSPRTPDVRRAPGGLPGAGPLRVLAAGRGLRAIVASVPQAEYDEASLAKGLQDLDWVSLRALAHERVVEHFLTAPAILPMQLFTLFTSDERVLAHVTRDRARIERILTRVQRQVEWGVRLTYDEAAARQAVEAQHGGSNRTRPTKGAARRAGPAGPAGNSGAGYLARKRDLLDVTRGRLAAARAEADRLYRSLSREATDARRRTATEQAAQPGSRLLLDAAFLVPARGGRGFQAALRKQAHVLETAGIGLSLTGPWPPYNFIDSNR